ncbi:MAG: 4-hydroxyphenylpyruvate dioxygenase [Bdellovibrionales bacterium]|nr:4-hydroxyphenylpyruvate dioxygenase [Bdellovibrionales bacterium]
MTNNPLGMKGISFIEFSSENPATLRRLFRELGFSMTYKHPTLCAELFVQNDIRILLNFTPDSAGVAFARAHGDSVSALGWTFESPHEAQLAASKRGGEDSSLQGDYLAHGQKVPAIKGIGGSLIYFVAARNTPELVHELGLVPATAPLLALPKGFECIDHLTNNVPNGTMEQWRKFYTDVFDFRDVRSFDIRGRKTGLHSYALRSPDGSFCIPINEASESKSQINEYLDRHRGPGVQHIAFLTRDLIESLQRLEGSSIRTLDIQPSYYDHVFTRVPGVSEDRELIQDFNILVDGDSSGYLLQIFTRDLVGPIFLEFIQRNNHLSFGEGNFQALFDSIERDQEKRGVL